VTGKRRAGPPRKSDARAGTTPGSGTSAFPVATRKTRRELRAERKRQQRRRIGAAGIAGIVVAALIAAAAITFGVQKAGSHDKKQPLGQTTLLLSVAAPDRSAAETVLLAHDSKAHAGVELLIPARLLTQVCGFGNQPLGRVLALPGGEQLSRGAVSDALGGVKVDGSWVLTTGQLSTLINEVGGITVDVDTDVIEKKPDGSRVLLIQRGPQQHLTGTNAVAFATYSVGNQDAAANLVRLQSVLDGLLAALPRSESAVKRLVTSVGGGATSTLGAARLAALLTGLAADKRANNVLPADLPVVKIDAGGPPAYRADDAQVHSFVQANLAASLPPGAGAVRKRVFVQNGVGTPGLVGTACSRLVHAGYVFAGSGNAVNFGFKTSKVLVFSNTVAAATLGNDVAHALRLPETDVAVSPQGQNVADVVVILGKDYKP